MKKLTAAQMHELYANDDLALSITSTLDIINALSEQIKLLEKVERSKGQTGSDAMSLS